MTYNMYNNNNNKLFINDITTLPLQLLQEIRQVSLTSSWVGSTHTPKDSQVESQSPSSDKEEHVKPGNSHAGGK